MYFRVLTPTARMCDKDGDSICAIGTEVILILRANFFSLTPQAQGIKRLKRCGNRLQRQLNLEAALVPKCPCLGLFHLEPGRFRFDEMM